MRVAACIKKKYKYVRMRITWLDSLHVHRNR